jgi:hypothetical protein
MIAMIAIRKAIMHAIVTQVTAEGNCFSRQESRGHLTRLSFYFIIIIMITFKFDPKIEKDIFNEYVKPKKSKPVVEAIEKEITTVIFDINRDAFLTELTKYIKVQWEEVAPHFYKRLGEFYGIEISEPDITCYLTRLDIFPYNYDKASSEKWFSAPMFGNPVERIRVIMHELCHFFQPQELPRDIKEAIPVILNDHERFHMYSMDKGHNSEGEQKWRKIIWDLYSSGKNFKDLLKLINSSKS